MSRNPISTGNHESEDEEEMYVNFIIREGLPKSITLTEMAEATSRDDTLQKVRNCISTGSWNNCNDLKGVKQVANELSFDEKTGIILRGHRILVPISLQDKIIDLAHVGHQGIVKTKQLLRETVWFPGLDKKVEDIVKSCPACQLVTDTTAKVPLNPSKLPAGPW